MSVSKRRLIKNLADLCNYFGAEEPRSLNRRVYKDTACGASISLQLADGRWLHNGGRGWETLPRSTPILGFTIQTIIEGSDATIDSPVFPLPVRESEVREWIADMEAEAARLHWPSSIGDDDADPT
jgi:hypothetical protein